MADLTRDDLSLQALLSLLESEDSSRVGIMIEQMRAFPETRLQRMVQLVSTDSPASQHLNLILAEREAPRTRGALLQWLKDGADLEEGTLIVARSGYPGLDVARVQTCLDDLAEGVRSRLRGREGSDALDAVTTYMHVECGFHGDVTRYHDPDNSYLNRVLERRIGLPLTLAVLYILIGRRLSLPISGLALPGHFITALSTTDGSIFFDPFHDGTTLSLHDVMRLVRTTGHVFRPDHLRAATSHQVIRRMLANLLQAYQVQEELERADLVRQFLAEL